MSSREIRQGRKRLGLSLGELARRLGVARVTVTRWENGARKPSRVAAVAIRTVLTARPRGDWEKLAQAALNELWDNPEDAVYDHWRAHYRPETR